MLAQQALAWLLTYLLHSTLLLSLAWLASKPLARWSVAAEEAVWKVALVGALVTASIQLGAGWQPAAGTWRLAQERPAVAGIPAEIEGTVTTAPVTRSVAAPHRFARMNPPAAAVPSAPEAASNSTIPTALLGLWALGAAVLAGAYVRSYSRIRRRLRTRPRVVGGSLLTQLRDLAAGAGLNEPVRLSCSSRVPVPLALGVRQPEICIPPRALAGLSEEQQQGLLAHELAHLVRRDPVWLAVSHLMAAVFFFQPLNWVARRRLREISEMLSDEWAVENTGRPLSLAGCLAEVAGWSVSLRSLPLPGMADRPSNLARRIRRLLDETRRPEHPARRLWLGAAMVALLIAVVAAAPAVSAARSEALQPPKTPQAAPAPQAAESPQPANHEKDDSWLDARPEHDREMQEVAEMRDKDHGEADAEDVDVEDGEVIDPHNFDVGNVGDGTAEAMEEAMDSEAMGQASAYLDASLERMNDQLASLGDAGLSREQQKKLEMDIERINEDVQKRLQPRLEQLSREMSEKMAHLKALDPEMEKLQREMEKLASQMRPSQEALDKMRAEAYKMRGEALTAEQREKLRAEARRMAESMKPTEEQRRRMEALREELHKRHEEMAHEFTAENREQIRKAQAEMREEIEREMRGVREELHRAMEQRHQLGREERREMREKALKDRAHEKAKEKDKAKKVHEKEKAKEKQQKDKEKEKDVDEDDGSR
ncbi:MAG TPA: M56 family metallopeptidase [Thermoanaerobaculia bacterium]|nr:M56 family metallopeptidase [Thermoanaerobaculia bacterium]